MLYKSNGQTIEYDVSELDSIAFSEKKPKYVTSFTLSETSITLQPDETKTLTATVLPADADNKALAWTSSDEAVVEVNKNGRIIANANDTYVITYSATDGSGVKAECQMTVTSDNLGTINGRDYVDLGLPSGTKWATCNVGASSPEEYGDYWSSSLDPDGGYGAYGLFFYSGFCIMNIYECDYGLAVHPVCP